MEWPEVRVKGEAYLLLSLWLLLIPLKLVAAMLFAVFVHEMGHLIALRFCGVRVWTVEVGAFGARIDTEEMEPKRELVCALAGPGAGLVLCICFHWIPAAGMIALVQSVFNLLPIYPLDGGRAVRAARNICCKSR